MRWEYYVDRFIVGVILFMYYARESESERENENKCVINWVKDKVRDTERERGKERQRDRGRERETEREKVNCKPSYFPSTLLLIYKERMRISV
jgi:hypothetical protein